MTRQVFFPFLALLSTVGFLLSLYFALVYHKLIKPDSSVIPQVCRMDESSCGSLLRTKEAALFGLPNFYLGLAYYAALLTVPMLSERFFWSLWYNFAGASVLTVVAGGYLSYALIAKLNVPCVLCFAAHTINLFIALLMFSAL